VSPRFDENKKKNAAERRQMRSNRSLLSPHRGFSIFSILVLGLTPQAIQLPALRGFSISNLFVRGRELFAGRLDDLRSKIDIQS
jgi:hypothetical protein